MHDFPEADWRVLRELSPVALDRFCGRVLGELKSLVDDGARGTNHQRYLALFKLLHERDDELANAFNDMRRSRAIHRLVGIRQLGLLTDAEFARLSESTRQSVTTIVGIHSQ